MVVEEVDQPNRLEVLNAIKQKWTEAFKESKITSQFLKTPNVFAYSLNKLLRTLRINVKSISFCYGFYKILPISTMYFYPFYFILYYVITYINKQYLKHYNLNLIL